MVAYAVDLLGEIRAAGTERCLTVKQEGPRRHGHLERRDAPKTDTGYNERLAQWA